MLHDSMTNDFRRPQDQLRGLECWHCHRPRWLSYPPRCCDLQRLEVPHLSEISLPAPLFGARAHEISLYIPGSHPVCEMALGRNLYRLKSSEVKVKRPIRIQQINSIGFLLWCTSDLYRKRVPTRNMWLNTTKPCTAAEAATISCTSAASNLATSTPTFWPCPQLAQRLSFQLLPGKVKFQAISSKYHSIDSTVISNIS